MGGAAGLGRQVRVVGHDCGPGDAVFLVVTGDFDEQGDGLVKIGFIPDVLKIGEEVETDGNAGKADDENENF